MGNEANVGDAGLVAEQPGAGADRPLAEHKEAKLIRCALSNFSPSSLDFEVLFDVEEGPPTDPFLIRSAIYVRILERFAEEGVEFAYPTQTTFTAAPDGKFVMPWPDGKH